MSVIRLSVPRLTVTIGTALLLLSVIQNAYCVELLPGDQRPLPDIRWYDADGNSHHLHDSDGKPRVLHFWAAWCIPCRRELPEMLQWQRQNSDILLLPLSLDQRLAQSRHFLDKYQLAMPPLLLNKDDSDALDISVVPFTILVSADGLLLGKLYGIAPWSHPGFSKELRSILFPEPR